MKWPKRDTHSKVYLSSVLFFIYNIFLSARVAIEGEREPLSGIDPPDGNRT